MMVMFFGRVVLEGHGRLFFKGIVVSGLNVMIWEWCFGAGLWK